MTRYRITFESTELREVYVEAESESAARQCWIDGYYTDDSLGSSLIETVSENVVSVDGES